MTSKFRRGHNKNIVLLKSDVSDLQDGLNDVKANTDNSNIINIINPVSDNLFMNSKDIILCDNIDLKTINNSGYVANPASANINIGGYSINNALNISTDNIELKTINTKTPLYNPSIENLNMDNKQITNINGLSGNAGNPINVYNELRSIAGITTGMYNSEGNMDITATDTLTLKSTNDLIYIDSNLSMSGYSINDVNNVSANTFNGGSIITSPLSTDFNANSHNITNASNIDTKTINSKIPLYNPSIANLNMGAIHSIQNCNEITANNTYTKTLQSNDAGSMVCNSNISMGTKDIFNISTLTANNINTNLINSKIPLYNPSVANLNMGTNNITGVENIASNTLTTTRIDSSTGTLYIDAGIGVEIMGECKTADLVVTSGGTLYGLYDVQGTFSLGNQSDILGATNIETKDLKSDGTITSTVISNSGTAEIKGETTLRNTLKMDVSNYNNQIQMTDNKNTVWGDAIGFINVRGSVGGSHMTIGSYGTTADENGIIVHPNNQNITLQTNTQYVRLSSNGEFRVGSGVLRVGQIVQDTALTAYGQLKYIVLGGLPGNLAVPLTPSPALQVSFIIAISPHNVFQTASTITIQYAGIYRIVASLNGVMGADRAMNLYLRKNGVIITTLFSSRVGNRSVEISINELSDLIVGDVIDIAVQALDAAFNFDIYGGVLQVERVRKNFM